MPDPEKCYYEQVKTIQEGSINSLFGKILTEITGKTGKL